MRRFLRFENAPVTGALLILICVIYGLTTFDKNEVLYRFGAIDARLITQHEYWRAVTGMFLHANLVHLLANAFSLWQLGTLYEVMFGSRRFAFIYFTTGIIASLASALFTFGPSVGASGAVLGILGAFIFSILRSPQWRHERWTRSLIAQLIFWAAVNLLLPLEIKNIDSVAHIAGLISGLILGLLPHRVPPPPPGGAIIDLGPGVDPAARTAGR